MRKAKKTWLSFSILFFVLFWTTQLLIGQTSGNYKITTSKICSGAAPNQTSTGYKMSSAIGQNTSSPKLQDTEYNLISGFPGIGFNIVTEVAVSEKTLLPNSYQLFQNYPNPFNAETIIEYQLPKESNVTLRIFNSLGQKIITLVNKKQAPGFYSIDWNGKNIHGSKVASGIYIINLEADKFVKSMRILLLQ